MANQPAPDSDEPAPLDDGGGKSKKKLILIVVPLLLIAGGGAAAFFTGALDPILGKKAEGEAKPGEEAHGEEAAEKAEGGEHGEGATGPSFVKIPDLIVNLSAPDGQPRYLRLSVQLELEKAEDAAAIEKVLPRVIDQFQTYLRELRVSDLKGSKGIYRLQIELLSRVNAAAAPIKVKDVLFQEILVQ